MHARPGKPSSLKRFVAALSGALLVAIGLVALTPPMTSSQAADLSQFNPNYIISDALMFDSNAMSVGDIQYFLNQKVPNCRSGYTCLKDYQETTHTIGATPMCSQYDGAANESAAQIIYKVQVTCGISAKALIVILQKEQGLVTDTWPSSRQYRSAMGAGCPDTADCDSNYYGFFNQVHYGAYLLKRYTQPAGTGPGTEWNSRFDLMYPVGSPTFVQYNPDSGCGGTTLTIANQATHALYVYTPYQPNAAALAGGYGVGDGCSAYGNRNFYNYYSDWFGFTQSLPNGYIDSFTQLPNGSIQVKGWAFDADQLTSKASVEVVEDGVRIVGAGQANLAKPGLGSVYPAAGDNRAFDITSPASNGSHTYCVRVANLPDGTTYGVLGCKTFQVNLPVGYLDSLTVENSSGQVRLTGWTFDNDTTAPINVDVYVDGTKQATWLANVDRGPGFTSYFPNQTSLHGFNNTLTVSNGTHTICVKGVNVSGGQDATLSNGCVTRTIGASPIGYLDSATFTSTTQLNLVGWTFDDDTTAPINVDVYVDGIKQATWAANIDRGAGFKAIYPNQSSTHGFNNTITLTPGNHTICVKGVNVLAGADTNLSNSCVTRSVGVSPVGYLDTVATENANGQVRLTGWTFDDDTTAPINVDVYVDGTKQATWLANVDRGSAFRNYFPNQTSLHGFNNTLTVSNGTHTICVKGVNVSGGQDTTLNNGCVTRMIGASPIGYLDSATFTSPGQLNLVGWTFDDDTTAAINVDVYVDGLKQATWAANIDRGAGFKALYPNQTSTHGFNNTITLAPGNHTICVKGVNVMGGSDTNLTNSCVTRSVGVSPVGYLDTVVTESTGGQVRLTGWSFDNDTTAPINVGVFVDGSPTPAATWLANVDRGAGFTTIFPNQTSTHGFNSTITLTPGAHTICVKGLNVLGGQDTVLNNGCVTRTINGSPIGYLDSATFTSPGQLNLVGWTFDDDTTAPINVDVYVDGTKQTTWPANVDRGAGFKAIYPSQTSLHGYNNTISLTSGTHTVCVKGVNVLGGSDTQLTNGCVTRTVN